ncbi:MAG: glycosyltransferase [Azospirillum sp.]|nr:glycosyltransferase [Azospirillum sp.]
MTGDGRAPTDPPGTNPSGSGRLGADRPARRLAVITAVRNDRAGLLRTHASLRAQSWRGFDWLVVDGGSEDGTAEYLAAISDQLAWWRSRPDHGPYHAMSCGLAAARSDYILFLNAGDTLAGAGTLAAIAEAVTADPRIDFLYGDALETGGGRNPVLKPARSHRSAWYGMFTHHQAMVYRRGTVADLRFDPRYRIGADYAFTLQALARARRVVRLPVPLCVFAAGGLSQRHTALGRQDQARIRRDLLGWPPLATAALMQVQQAVQEVRDACPALYRLLRCRAATPSHPTPAVPNHDGDLVPGALAGGDRGTLNDRHRPA